MGLQPINSLVNICDGTQTLTYFHNLELQTHSIFILIMKVINTKCLVFHCNSVLVNVSVYLKVFMFYAQLSIC